MSLFRDPDLARYYRQELDKQVQQHKLKQQTAKKQRTASQRRLGADSHESFIVHPRKQYFQLINRFQQKNQLAFTPFNQLADRRKQVLIEAGNLRSTPLQRSVQSEQLLKQRLLSEYKDEARKVRVSKPRKEELRRGYEGGHNPILNPLEYNQQNRYILKCITKSRLAQRVNTLQ